MINNVDDKEKSNQSQIILTEKSATDKDNKNNKEDKITNVANVAKDDNIKLESIVLKEKTIVAKSDEINLDLQGKKPSTLTYQSEKDIKSESNDPVSSSKKERTGSKKNTFKFDKLGVVETEPLSTSLQSNIEYENEYEEGKFI